MFWETCVEQFAGNETEYGIAQKLQALVVSKALVLADFVEIASVYKGLLQKRQVVEVQIVVRGKLIYGQKLHTGNLGLRKTRINILPRHCGVPIRCVASFYSVRR